MIQRAVLFAFACWLSLGPVAAQEDLAGAARAFEAAPSHGSANALAERVFARGSQGDWPAIAQISPEALAAALDLVPADAGAELLLYGIQAKGAVGKAEARDALIETAEAWAQDLPQDAARTLSINLGYVLLQTGAPERALERLHAATHVAEAEGRGADLMSLCGLGSATFERFGYLEQAGVMYRTCDQSAIIRQTSLPDRGIFWHNYALFLREAGALAEAVQRHHWSLNELAAQFGFPSAEVNEAYDAMGQTLLAQGDLGAADSTASLALHYAQQVGGQDETYWRIINNAAAIKRALRLPVPAQGLDYQAYIWRRDTLGPEHPLTYASWMNYALDLVEMEAWEEAKGQFITLYQRQQAGAPVPYSHEVLSYYLYYLDARLAFARGEAITLPSVLGLAELGAPMELFAGVADLVVDRSLAEGDPTSAAAMAQWTADLMVQRLPDGHPMRFEMALLQARALGGSDPERVAALVRQADLDLFNWTRRQALSGSYDASSASRALADDLLLFMAELSQRDPSFQPSFAHALHRWKTLESPSDRAVDQVPNADVAPDLKLAARQYGLAAARFRETVRAAPISTEIAAMDAALSATRAALNPRLDTLGMARLVPPLAPLQGDTEPPFAVTPGDVVIDMILLRDWGQPDRSGWSTRLALFAAIHRPGAAPEVQEVTRLDFSEDGDVYGALWRDLGLWLHAQTDGAERVFLVPDGLLFQMDLLEARDAQDRRLGAVTDVYLLSDRGAYGAHDAAATLDAQDRITLAGGLYYSDQGPQDPNYLPGSLAEIDAIGALARQVGARVARLQGFDGTTDRVVAEAQSSQVVHLATHGFFNGTDETPYSLDNAGLVLSSQGAPEQALAADVMQWDLSGVELVVLSACLSGVGRDTPIDAVRGLPLSLARAGAQRSLVTLQEIPDRQTALIMERFYRYLTQDNLPYAQAFLHTKRDIWAGRIDTVPAHTAQAFVLYGH